MKGAADGGIFASRPANSDGYPTVKGGKAAAARGFSLQVLAFCFIFVLAWYSPFVETVHERIMVSFIADRAASCCETSALSGSIAIRRCDSSGGMFRAGKPGSGRPESSKQSRQRESMKRDLKPFVVEVKRGTRRSSFLEHMDQTSTMTAAQRRAEAALFAPVIEEAAPRAVASEPSRRILPSLVEPALPPQLEPEDLAPDVEQRRPRPVGRPRKPRPAAPTEPDRETAALVATATPPAASAPADVEAPALVSADVEAPLRPTPSAEDRTRLRDRSAILARYVLKTRPAPGERWNLASRREARRARGGAE